MSDQDDMDPMERALEVYFSEHDRVSPLSIETAQAMFSLRHVDAEVAELVDSEAAVRGDDDETVPLRFEVADTSIIVNVMPGVVDVAIDPRPLNADLEVGVESVAFELDSGGAASAAVTGVARVRVTFGDGRVVVTDPFVVPRR